MSRNNYNSPVAPILSPVKSEGHLNKTILSGLFSKQFLGCLKDELSARTKESRPAEDVYRQALIQVKAYKKQLETMRAKIQQLTQINQTLARKLQLYESTELPTPNSQLEPTVVVCPPNTPKHLELSIPAEQAPGREEEVVRLRERIEKLEVHKSIKEQRLNEMLEKELRFDSEVKFLKVKNSELEDEVKSLRETIILQTSEKALIGTLNSQADIAISHHFDIESPSKPQPSTSHLMPIAEGSLTASFTNNVTIPADLTLSKACLRQARPQQQQGAEFNEIDYMLGEELPYLKVSDELQHSQKDQQPSKTPVANLNESIVLININTP